MAGRTFPATRPESCRDNHDREFKAFSIYGPSSELRARLTLQQRVSVVSPPSGLVLPSIQQRRERRSRVDPRSGGRCRSADKHWQGRARRPGAVRIRMSSTLLQWRFRVAAIGPAVAGWCKSARYSSARESVRRRHRDRREVVARGAEGKRWRCGKEAGSSSEIAKRVGRAGLRRH